VWRNTALRASCCAGIGGWAGAAQQAVAAGGEQVAGSSNDGAPG
jgi:hypothetical protein